MPKKADEPEPQPEPETDSTDWKAEAEKWKKLSRDNEAKAKANADAATKLQEIEDGEKSDLEKANKRVEEAEKKAAAAERNALRSEVALAKGLNAAQAKRLVGDTKDELEADADELLETFGNSKPETGDGDADDDSGKPPGGGRPVEDVSGGGDPTTDPEPDLEKIADEIAAESF